MPHDQCPGIIFSYVPNIRNGSEPDVLSVLSKRQIIANSRRAQLRGPLFGPAQEIIAGKLTVQSGAEREQVIHRLGIV